jgi:hypothetical protein
VLVFLLWAPSAFAGGPFMMVGAADDVVKAQDYAFAKAEMDKLKLAGLDTIRLTQTWTKGQTALGPNDTIILGNAMKAAQFTGVRVILSIYPFGSSVTPLTELDRLDFTQFAADVVKRYPLLHDIIIGNEPNLNRFWLPQFGANGEDVAAPAYEQLLAETYDALKAVRPHSTIYGGALAPRGVDKPNTGRDTHSPTAFINDLGATYKASGRQIPIMDAFAFHPYPENSETGPNFPHPNSTSIGLADYGKLVALLGAAFDGTAQRGTTLPILYDEFGIETTIPASKASLYTGTEPATTKPVDETMQADLYREAMQMTFCQPTALGILLFHFQDEAALSGWQSGVFYVDGTAKASLYPVRGDAFDVHRGIVAGCPGLQLTPKLVITTGKPGKTGIKVTLTCSLDCNYTVTLDNRPLTGMAVGKTPKTLIFTGALRAGVHRVTAQGVVPVNTGPAGTASLSFRSH